jgi:glutathione-regulated potassium-efflux system ancillary protein KefG
MKKILILFAHPAFHQSRINKELVSSVQHQKGITFNNLYENYPDFYIDVEKEKRLLLEHDIIVWHHPFYWYSAPAILKEWFDLVLQHGFAYGTHGRALEGKTAFSVISTGGRKEVYSKEGRHHHTVNQFLAPFRQSANLCRMEYLPPFVVHGSHTIKKEEIVAQAKNYLQLLEMLRDEKTDLQKLLQLEYLNDLME